MGLKIKTKKYMKISIQYYDSLKENQIPIEDFAIELFRNLPLMYDEFGYENVFIYTDIESKNKLTDLGIDTSRIFCPEPPEKLNHTLRWLSIMAIITTPFQISPVEKFVKKLDDEYLTVDSVNIVPFNPTLAKYGIEQTGGVCGGDIIGINDINMMLQAYVDARDIILKEENVETITEMECRVIVGAMLYKVANEMQITITKYP